MAEKILRLPIKRIYYDQIKRGEKRFEYRRVSPYFERAVAKGPTILVLHYYQSNYIEAEIKAIRKRLCPVDLGDLTFLGTHVFEFKLGLIRERIRGSSA